LKFSWKNITDEGIAQYNIATDRLLSEIDIPYASFLYEDCNCSNVWHLQDISTFYNNIIRVLQTAVEDCVPNIKSHRNQQIPGWNKHVKDSDSLARDAFHLWVMIGKPRQGVIDNHIKFSRSRFNMLSVTVKRLKKKSKTC
jgi:hypothetical protein